MVTQEPGAEGVTELSSVQQEDRARELAGGGGCTATGPSSRHHTVR